MKKNVKLIVLILLAITLFASVFSSCSVEQSLDYKDVIESRYGDAFKITSTYGAPKNAVEYTNTQRVTKEILIDSRIVGVHLTGLYLPAGESATITIDASELGSNHHVLCNQNVAGENSESSSYLINEVTTTITRGSTGGLIELDIKEAQTDTFKVKISGCIESGFYRYGLDHEKSAEIRQGNYLTYDASNIRLYIPIEYISGVENIKSALCWWRNAMVFMDRICNLSWYGGDYSPLRIYAEEKQALAINPDTKSIILPKEYANTMISFEKLSNGDNGKVLSILKSIAQEKFAKTEKYNSSILKDSLCEIMASITYANMVDFEQVVDSPINDILFSDKCVSKVIENNFSDDIERQLYFFMNLYHNYGEEAVYEIVEKLEKVTTIEDELYVASKTVEADLSCFEEMFNVSASNKDEITFEKHYLVANSLMMGMYNFKNQTGLYVLADQKTAFNFDENMIGNGWSVVEIRGSEGKWSKNSEGLYVYNPSKNKLRDSFELIVSDGVNNVSLKNNITVNIAVASRVVYKDVDFDTLDEAIKGYKDLSADIKESIEVAAVVKEDVLDESKRSFAITTGWMEVPRDDTYTLYLKCSGLIKVDFGVKDYITEIFNNSLTVPSYTHELSYKLKLKKGFQYYFRIYDLSNSGAGYAMLGIADSDRQIKDVGSDFIIASDLTREQIVEYENPQKEIDAIYMQSASVMEGEIKHLSFGGLDSYTLGETSENIAIGDKVNIVATFINISHVDFIKFIVGEKMDGVTLKIFNDNAKEKVIKEVVLKEGENDIDIDKIKTSSLIFEFSSDNIFNIQIEKIAICEKQPKMTIIPATSTSIEFIGEWYTDYSYIAVNGSIVVSKSESSAISYSFNGNKIAIYSTRGPSFGAATVYIDGIAQDEALSLYSAEVECSQLVYNLTLKDGDHTIRIVADGDTPINIDYLAVANKGATVTKNDFSKLWYVTFIPAIVLIGGIVCFILDKRSKKRN